MDILSPRDGVKYVFVFAYLYFNLAYSYVIPLFDVFDQIKFKYIFFTRLTKRNYCS